MSSGDQMGVITARNSLPTTTASASRSVLLDGSTVVGQVAVLIFPGSTPDSHGEWSIKLNKNYSGGGLTLQKIRYAMDGTDGSAVQFELRMLQLDIGDVVTAHDLQAATATDITDTPEGTADKVDEAPSGSVSHANAGSPAIGDTVRVRLSRDYDHAVNADDLQFIDGEVVET